MCSRIINFSAKHYEYLSKKFCRCISRSNKFIVIISELMSFYHFNAIAHSACTCAYSQSIYACLSSQGNYPLPRIAVTVILYRVRE